MSLTTILFFIIFFTGLNESLEYDIISRKEWGAKPPTERVPISGKLPYVIIHHSYIPEACYTTVDCKKSMLSMQLFHQNDRGWADIGYSYAIGGDGKIYEGRGFNIVGAHAPGYNDKSIGICLIGDWTNKTPPSVMLDATKYLINYGVSRGHIESDYVIYGHRQVRHTECPGNALFDEIKGWPHFGNIVRKLV